MQKIPVTLIKLGGSIITNKDTPMSLRQEVLSRLVEEVATAWKELSHEELLVVGHGQGSFAHVPAHKYGTMHGFKDEESRLGMAIVQDNAAQLNRIVVQEFIKHQIPAVSLNPSNCLVTKHREADSYCTDVFEEYIKQGLFPITGGDVIVDRGQGCTIWSTEEVLAFFAREFVEKGWNIKQIIHVTDVDGFLDENKHVVPAISADNWSELKKSLTKGKGVDVTGGMGLKVEESLSLAQIGISSKIISGLTPNNLYNTLIGENWIGTEIRYRAFKHSSVLPTKSEYSYAV